MTSALDLYNALVARGTQPALTWYGDDGRMELSAKVAANHMAKIAGYLADEVWLDEGASLVLDLPAHWKTCLWGLGAMLAGLKVTVGGGEGGDCAGTDGTARGAAASGHTASFPVDRQLIGSATSADAIVTSNPASAQAPGVTAGTAGDAAVIALDLGPLALSWTGAPLPAGTFDGSAEVMGSPDQLMDDSRHAAGNFAQWEAAGVLAPDGPRLALVGDAARDPVRMVAAAAWQLGRGSLVVVADDSDPTTVAKAEGAESAKLPMDRL
ncbi:MAG: TIGR03089 family protein [Ancrocorticia sp.]|uniref:TIGR03089 family protein n=1 Tax=Ancrocorticia sp. TaxID=2593684 RepID=UPI003F8F3CFC